MTIRVLIVDDHAIFRRGLRSLLAEEADIEVVGEADSGPTTLAAVARLDPDVVTLDIRLGGVDGIQTARQLQQQHPQARVMFLTTYEDSQYLLGAFQAGAYAYLLKNTSYDTLAGAIRSVQRGQRMLAPELVHHVLDEYRRLAQERLRQEVGLSEQEIEVLRLLADGKSVKEIAFLRGRAQSTIYQHIVNIGEQLGVSGQNEIIAFAVRHGLV
jgi:DNA-binding NarL/FixJ family response regulator